MNGDKYNIRLGNYSDGRLFIRSKKGEKNVDFDNGETLLKFLSEELTEIFPREICVWDYEGFTREMSEAIDQVVNLYNSNRKKYQELENKIKVSVKKHRQGEESIFKTRGEPAYKEEEIFKERE